MPLQVVHSEYVSRIALEIAPQHGLRFPEVSMEPWWVSGATLSYGNAELLVHRYKGRELPMYFLFLDKVPNQRWTIEYLLDVYRIKDPLPDGGLVFIDQVTGELIETNWELGETEEWAEILEHLLATGSVLHTFSVTDAAIEIHSIPEGTVLQNLSWEALPDRLESSRKTEPRHVFEDQKKFVAKVQRCLNQLDTFLTIARTLPQDCKSIILDYSSAKHRCSHAKGIYRQ